VLFFGWGSKVKEFVLGPSHRIVVVGKYAHLMFLLTVVFGQKYILATATEQGWMQREITKEEATNLNQGFTPNLHWYWRFSLLGWIGLGVVFGLVSILLSL